jgi:hypothetical protein
MAAVISAGERTAGTSECGGGGWEELGGGLDMIEPGKADTKCYVAARVWEGERGLRGREKAGRGPFAHGRARGKGFPS